MNGISAEQLHILETLLIEREKQLRAEIASARQLTRQRIASRGREVIDLKEDATDEAVAEVEDAENERDMAELREVEAARERMGEGVYGRCLDCDEPIAAKRLLAQPAALRCAACQTAQEVRFNRRH